MGGIVWSPPRGGSGGGLATASNGLTAVGTDVQFGGSLITPTSLDVNTQGFTIYDAASSLLTAIFEQGTVNLTVSDGIGAFSEIVMDGFGDGIGIVTNDNAGNASLIQLLFNSFILQFSATNLQIIEMKSTPGIEITDDGTGGMGFVYNADYSAFYVDRSLPDVAWVLAQLGGSSIINTPEQAITSTIFFTSTTDPSTPNNLNYQWTQAGKLVTVRFNLDYAAAGSNVTVCAVEFPADLPLPKYPTGFANSADIALFGAGGIGIGIANEPTTFPLVWLTTLPGIQPYVSINVETGVNMTTAWATLTYFAV